MTPTEKARGKIRQRFGTEARRKAFYDRFGGRCYYCKRPMTFRYSSKRLQLTDFTIDHVVPIVFGGTSDYSNLVAACYQCNHHKAKSEDPNRIPW